MTAFERARRAIDAHDLGALRTEIAARPGLVADRDGANANTLLGMATATGDERTVRMLLVAGADPGQANLHGWTALHQAGYADQPALAELLLDAGADPSAYGRGDGGTGDAALIGSLAGTPEAGVHRGFYRPHSGFPEWTPSDDPQEVLDEALAYAARGNRAEVLRLLIDSGARLEADVYRGTALGWAAASGAPAAARELLALGAAVDGRTSFGGLGYGTPDGWAEHAGHADLAARIRGT